MATRFTNLDQPKGLGQLNGALSSESYITGYAPSKDDADLWSQIKPGSFDAKKFPHLGRWYNHIKSYSEQERHGWGTPGATTTTTTTNSHPHPHPITATTTTTTTTQPKEEHKETAAAAKKEDDFELFGDLTDEDKKNKEEKQKQLEKEKEEKEKAEKEKAGKKVVIARSAIIFDVSPWEADEEGKTTLVDAIEVKVRKIEMPGLEWKAKEIVKVAYGVNKLRILCHVVDDLVSVDNIQEKIEENEDIVQSVTIFSFNKLP